MRRFQTAPVVDENLRNSKINMGRKEFGDQLKILGINLTKRQIDRIFKQFDDDNSGDIDLIEFISNIHQDYTGESYFENDRDLEKASQSECWEQQICEGKHASKAQG